MLMRIPSLVLAAAFTVSASTSFAENVRIAFIDPLSGPFAPVGQNLFNSFKTIAELSNQKQWGGQNTVEIVGFDNKGSPQESLIQLKSAIDQGYRYITQGNGSGVALALIDAINKHNERNPGKEVLFLNHSAGDPALTNSKCSFWHFRFDANSEMKMESLTTFMAKDPKIKKIYIIGQNYALGQEISRSTRAYMGRKRPDVQIVGDDLHPIGQVKDFSPYVAKMKASGADTIITANWGADLALLVRAARDADLKANFYTLYAATTGVPTAMGAAGLDRVKYVAYWNLNNETYAGKEIIEGFKKKYNDDYYAMASYTVLSMLGKAFKESGSTDPVKVALAMEGMKVKSLNGEVEMRKSDHQAQQPLYIATWVKQNNTDVKFDQENTGYGWRTDQKIDAYVAAQPTSCQMKRPSH
ncbi:MAG: branched-chain amino acid ABC transporter substrate-binding protein [Burkholderiaceae bacterium]|uniref:Branched-chain amino acid ABC transporter substrate-binding protein n=1 Tax=Herminiimonas contaminans TaxID=1111140 RepID=A0ABS0ETY5_9BURK|nr:branched-chain amino acid ABC transporter substrate-binding protein [Herminiimonas contaminans]MBX9799968.1 branched-chain amino acid ABC transporter substrate-binding protein [Burkholderiaceae bacterium]